MTNIDYVSGVTESNKTYNGVTEMEEMKLPVSRQEAANFFINIINDAGDDKLGRPQGIGIRMHKLDALIGVILAYGKDVGYTVNPLTGRVHLPDLEDMLKWAVVFSDPDRVAKAPTQEALEPLDRDA